MSKPTAWMRDEYKALVEANLDWRPPVLEGPSAPRCKVNGREMLMLCSNNYLNLSNHPRLKEAAIAAVRSHGAGSGSVRPIAGNMDLHVKLEQRIAEFKRRDAAIYYQTGFAANAGLIPQLVGKGDHLFTDELNHGSIIDGVRLTKAERNIYPHNDMGGLEDLLRKAPSAGRRLIITDGVFSMDGDTAPLDKICALAGEYGAMTYTDDAHGEGVLGNGRGIGVHYNVEDSVDIEMGTFSKAFGVVGGLAAGSEHLAKYAFNKSRTFLLSGSAPPATVAACTAALDVIDEEPQHVKRLWENTEYFRSGLQQLGYDTGNSTTPIIPAMCGSAKRAQALSAELLKRDVFALPIVFPMVARDKARIRVMMSAGLDREDLNSALSGFEKGGKSAGII